MVRSIEDMDMIKNTTQKLYSDIPQETLYHYTSFKGLLGIVDSGVLWASDVRYMNDSAEMKHTVDLIGRILPDEW